ncbi:hypothetical protein ACRAWG_06335 [Methylobacterium sp. P31]
MFDPPEILAEQVEEFAKAARQAIDARLRKHRGECPDFWEIVAGLYARGQPKKPEDTKNHIPASSVSDSGRGSDVGRYRNSIRHGYHLHGWRHVDQTS